MDRRGVTLDIDGIDIVGEIYIPKSGGSHPALIICHGIPRGVPDPQDRGYPLLAERFSGEGFVTMIFNFRGTGGSGGNLDLLGWTRDLGAVVDHIYSLPEVDKEDISLLGFSGGAAVSIYLAARDQRIANVVACSCPPQFGAFSSIERANLLIEHLRDIGTIRDPDFPPSLQGWLEGFSEISPAKWVENISPRAILIIHGGADEVIDPSQAQSLYARAGEPKEIVIVEGATHRLRQDERAMDCALKWLKSRVKAG